MAHARATAFVLAFASAPGAYGKSVVEMPATIARAWSQVRASGGPPIIARSAFASPPWSTPYRGRPATNGGSGGLSSAASGSGRVVMTRPPQAWGAMAGSASQPGMGRIGTNQIPPPAFSSGMRAKNSPHRSAIVLHAHRHAAQTESPPNAHAREAFLTVVKLSLMASESR